MQFEFSAQSKFVNKEKKKELFLGSQKLKEHLVESPREVVEVAHVNSKQNSHLVKATVDAWFFFSPSDGKTVVFREEGNHNSLQGKSL